MSARGRRHEGSDRRGEETRTEGLRRPPAARAPRRRAGWPRSWLLAVLFPLCSFLLADSSSAQTRTVEILNADYTEVTSDAGIGIVRRMTGNVRLRQDTTALRADRVVQYEAAGRVELSGRVRIISGRDTLTAAEVVYDATTKVAVARQDVRVGDGESTLFAPQATYDSRAEVSTFLGGGRILHRGAVLTSPSGTYSSATRLARLDGPLRLVDSTGVLTAARGTYDAGIQRADVAGAVRLVRPDARLDADSVVYFRRTERARAYRRVVLERIGSGRETSREGTAPADSTRRTFLFGETLVYDGQAETASVRGMPGRDPLAVVLRADSTGGVDTTLARAPRLDAVRVVAGADTLQVLTAAGGARLWQRRLGALADSLRFVRQPATAGRPARDRLVLRGADRPRVWADGAQLTGDSLDVVARGEALDSLLVVGRAFAARVDSTLGRLQQIAGGTMLGRFRDEQLRTLSVWPTAEALTYEASPEGLLSGAQRLSADSLAFRFVGGEVREVAGLRGVEGTIYGPRTVPAGVRLAGYRFTPADRPRPEALLDGWEAGWLDAWSTAHPDWAGPLAGPPPEPDTETEAGEEPSFGL